MSTTLTPVDELSSLIARARRRWRMRVALHGLGIVLACAVAVLVFSAIALERWQYSDDAIRAVRVLGWVAIAAFVARWLVLPMARRVPDTQVALYLEEKEPALDAALVSAVEQGHDAPAGVAHSPALVRRLRAQALERARALEARGPERRPLQQAS